MAENAGHLVVISISATLGSGYVEISGVTSVDLNRDRTVLETTHFKDPSGAKTRIMGLKDQKISISGNLDLADSPQSQLRTRYADGAMCAIQIAWDGSTNADGEFKVASYNEKASVDGLVEFSADLEGAPSSAAGVWG